MNVGPFSFAPYDDTVDVPNVVVDGSPNPATVLTLTHWPGIARPSGLEADLSAEMAYRYLRDPCEHAPAGVVTNNHFDQDGLVSVHALVEPDAALAHEDLLVDVAAAGDFATFRHRDAARASMTLAAYADPERSPIADELTGAYAEQTAVLYDHTLDLLVSMATESARYRDLWADEEDALLASEKALADGRITIDERPDVDLAIITVSDDEPSRRGHRFGGSSFDGVHPMAIHNATACVRLLVVHGRRYRYVDRYETWVQYMSKPVPGRVALGPLAARLEGLETGTTAWRADEPSALSPALGHDDESTLAPEVVASELIEHLRGSPVAWNPRTDGR